MKISLEFDFVSLVKPLPGPGKIHRFITRALQWNCSEDKVALSLFIALFTLCFTGCSSVVESKLHKSVRLESLKKAYVVRDPNSTHGCEEAAREALTQHGVSVAYGHFQDKPKDVDFYVEVVDRWQWDVAMFLVSLDIRFRDNATGDLIASGWFKQSSFFHTFPDQRQKTFEVIDKIYNAPPAPK